MASIAGTSAYVCFHGFGKLSSEREFVPIITSQARLKKVTGSVLLASVQTTFLASFLSLQPCTGLRVSTAELVIRREFHCSLFTIYMFSVRTDALLEFGSSCLSNSVWNNLASKLQEDALDFTPWILLPGPYDIKNSAFSRRCAVWWW